MMQRNKISFFHLTQARELSNQRVVHRNLYIQLENKAMRLITTLKASLCCLTDAADEYTAHVVIQQLEKIKKLALLNVPPAIQFFIKLYNDMLFSAQSMHWPLAIRLKEPLLEMYKQIGLQLEQPTILYHLHCIKAYDFLEMNIPALPQLSEAMMYLNMAATSHTQEAMICLYKLAYFYAEELDYAHEVIVSPYCRSVSDLYSSLKEMLQDITDNETVKKEVTETCADWGSKLALEDLLASLRAIPGADEQVRLIENKIIGLKQFLYERFTHYYELLLDAHVKFGLGVMFGRSLHEPDDVLDIFFLMEVMAKLQLGANFSPESAHHQYFLPFKNKLIAEARRGNYQAAYFLGCIAHHEYSDVLYQKDLNEAAWWYNNALAFTDLPHGLRKEIEASVTRLGEDQAKYVNVYARS